MDMLFYELTRIYKKIQYPKIEQFLFLISMP